VRRQKPINADTPDKPDPPKAPEAPPEPDPDPVVEVPRSIGEAPQPQPPEPPKEEPSKPEPTLAVEQEDAAPPSSPRTAPKPKPMTPKLLVALVLLAIGFIVAVVLAGTGGSGGGESVEAGPPATIAGGGEGGSEELGYPGFATSNTTRIDGSDPAAIAAASALVVYPSTADSQRPRLVTLVGEGDWAGGIAAAVLMAEPARAPVLVSEPGEVPDATAEALSALAPRGEKATDGAGVLTVGDVAVPAELESEPIAGGSAKASSGGAEEAATIAEFRDDLFGAPPAHVIVAPLSQPQIAMPAAAWAARSGDPVLFTGPEALPAATAKALKRYAKVPAYVLGPSSAISSAAFREIGKLTAGAKRVSGEGPVANALAFARYDDGGFGWDVNDPGHGFVLARDGEPLDAAAAAALSGSGTYGPLLLTDSATKLPAELREYFLDVKPGYTNNPTRAFYNHVWVIGDQEAIDVNQQAEVNELAELAKIGGEE
jgi:hypothetical protein